MINVKEKTLGTETNLVKHLQQKHLLGIIWRKIKNTDKYAEGKNIGEYERDFVEILLPHLITDKQHIEKKMFRYYIR